jgi:nucleoside 2-deoxyribosyltransferase
MTVVYLAGGINGLSDTDAKDWREHAKAWLIHDTLDPMRRDYRGKEDESVDEIVSGDLEDINKSDVILASCVRPSWGTAMEIHYATYIARKPVFAVVPEGQAVSPWLRHYTHAIYRTFEEAIDAINQEA